MSRSATAGAFPKQPAVYARVSSQSFLLTSGFQFSCFVFTLIISRIITFVKYWNKDSVLLSRFWVLIHLHNRRIRPRMDPATTDSRNTAVEIQGAMLGRHEQELSAARHAVETLAGQVSDLSGQFRSLRLVPPATSWSSESPEPRVNNPPCYSGQPTECRSFLTQCDIVFSLQPNTYSGERARIAYVISLRSGRAHV